MQELLFASPAKVIIVNVTVRHCFIIPGLVTFAINAKTIIKRDINRSHISTLFREISIKGVSYQKGGRRAI